MHVLHPFICCSLCFTDMQRVVALKPPLHFFGCNRSIPESLYLRSDNSDCVRVQQVVFIHPSWEKYHFAPTLSYQVLLIFLTSAFSVEDKTDSRGDKPASPAQAIINLKNEP